ncbi:hypothetical protein LINGRAHAP2_LOCUS30113 [Linum grandiflorum]
MWHCPDRVLRQFGMEQPIPRKEMLVGEVMVLLGLTRRREVGMCKTLQQYIGRWEMRDDHVAETGPVGISTTNTWTGIVPSVVGGYAAVVLCMRLWLVSCSPSFVAIYKLD